MRKKKKRKPEFSKIIFTFVSLFTVGISVFACVMMIKTSDLSALPTLIGSSFVEFGVGTAFYYSKAGKENEIKLNKQFGGFDDD